MTKQKVHLRRIDLVDKKLPLFLHIAQSVFATGFRIVHNDIVFRMCLGAQEDSSGLHSYTDIRFEADFNIDFSLFDQQIPLLVQTPSFTIQSMEHAELEQRKQEERVQLKKQLRDLLPVVVEAFNVFRRACRIARFHKSISGRVLVQNIKDGQSYRGLDVSDQLDELFDSDDTVFLFAAFSDISITAFTGDADIEYTVHREPAQPLTGVFKNGYHGLRSINEFIENPVLVQDTIDKGWSIETEALLASFEFLYSNNYRMAVFNAATVLELVVNRFWEAKEQQLRLGEREEMEHAARLARKLGRKPKTGTALERKLNVVVPEFVDKDLVDDGTIKRCVDAWNIRNNSIAHILGAEEITSGAAWSAVSAITKMVTSLGQVPC